MSENDNNEEMDDDEAGQPIVPCVLNISCTGDITASPIAGDEYQEIVILNRYHCYHCTHGDWVNVKIVSKTWLQKDSIIVVTGVVDSLIKSVFQLYFNNRTTILCTADTSNPGLMIPLNPQLPKIYICRKNQFIYDFSKDERDAERVIKIVRYLDKQTVYEVNIARNQDENFETRIKTGTFYPRGWVKRVSTKSCFELVEDIFKFNPMKLIAAYIEPLRLVSSKNDRASSESSEFSSESFEDSKFCFTIDKPGCRFMDDAFSVNFQEDETHITFGVHVVDVSVHIRYGNEREDMLSDPRTPDEWAYLYANSVYSSSPSYRNVVHMLTEETNKKLSIDLEKSTDVVTVYLTVDKSTGKIVDHKVRRENVQSKYKLTFDEADRIANGTSQLNEEVANVIKKMHKTALKMRDRRLGIRRWLPQKVLNKGCLIVDEFMIQTNSIVGQIIKSRFNGNIPVYVQKSYFLSEVTSGATCYDGHVLIETSVWSKVYESLKVNEANEAKNLLESELKANRFVYVPNWQFKKKSEYQLLSKCKWPSRHPETNADPYVHFTSPIRRYMDIVVHRLLLQAVDLSDEEIEYPDTRLASICNRCNVMKMYKKDLKTFTYCLDKATQCSQEAIVIDAIVTGIQNHSISLHFTLLDKCFHDMSILQYKHMSLSKFALNGDEATFHWSYEIYDYNAVNWKIWNFDDSKYVRFSEMDYLDMVQSLENLELNNENCIKFARLAESSQKKLLHLDSDGEQSSCIRHFESKCSIGTILRVQLRSALRRAVAYPSVQLIKLAKDFSICLEHQVDTFSAFGVSTEVSSKEAFDYEDYVEYQKYWVPLVNMAAVFSAIHSKTNVRIVNVAVEWLVSKDQEIGCIFELSKRFCVENQIYFNKLFPLNDVQWNIEFNIMLDYFCIEVPCPGQRGAWTWVAHCTSTHVEEHLSRWTFNCVWKPTCDPKVMPPKSVFEGVQNCTVEMFSTQIGERRMQEMLFDLKNAPSLTLQIALRQLEYKLPAHQSVLQVEKNSDLNIKQKEAIKNSFAQKFSLIWGPPGTGKTRTAVQLAHYFVQQLNKKQHLEAGSKKPVVLYCAQSNKAVDVAARFFLNCNETATKFNILRVYGRMTEYRVFKMPFHKNRNVPDCCVDCPLNICMHNRIRNADGCSPDNPFAEQVVETFDNLLLAADDAFSDVCHKIKSYKEARKAAEKWELQNADVVLMTCISATKSRLQIGSDNDTYSVEQVIIDEAGMCSELETLFPISQTRCSQVVLVGDHKQLAPIVKCRTLDHLRMGRSLFESYVDESEAVVMLEEQYRMHQKIMAFPSARFYKNRLKLGNTDLLRDSTLSIWPNKSVPMAFIHCTGLEKQTMITTHDVSEMSYSNKDEANLAIELALKLVESCKVPVSGIVIISPYRQQLKLIRQLIGDRRLRCLTNLQTITIVKSQGDEWDYVVFSTVRSKSDSYVIDKRLGTVADDRRINVALTRPKMGLFIVGNKDVLSAKGTWKSLVNHFEYSGTVFDCTTNCLPF